MQNIYKDIYTLQNNNRSYLPTSECSLLISVLCFLAPTCHPALLPSSTKRVYGRVCTNATLRRATWHSGDVQRRSGCSFPSLQHVPSLQGEREGVVSFYVW